MYRTAASRKPPDTEVLCRACAIRTMVNLEEARNETFTCSACGREQAILRDKADAAIEQKAIASDEMSAYSELEPLMVALGGTRKVTQVSLVCDGIKIAVSLSINSGTVTGVDMVATAPGLFDVRFLREDEAHRKAKDKGLSREAQTGDASFDEEVYIETSTSDDAVRTVLASSGVREAVKKLVADVGTVRIHGGQVIIYVAKDNNAFSTEAIFERLAALRMIAGAPRPIAIVEMPKSMRATLTMVFVYALTPLSLVLTLYTSSQYAPVDTLPYAIAVAAGIVFAMLLWPIYARLLRGRSTSHRDLRIARVASLLGGPLFMVGFLIFLNSRGAEPGKVLDLKVVSTSLDDDDKTKQHVEVFDPSGGRRSYTFSAPTSVNAPKLVRVTWHKGLLGWTWEGPTTFLYYSDPPRTP